MNDNKIADLIIKGVMGIMLSIGIVGIGAFIYYNWQPTEDDISKPGVLNLKDSVVSMDFDMRKCEYENFVKKFIQNHVGDNNLEYGEFVVKKAGRQITGEVEFKLQSDTLYHAILYFTLHDVIRSIENPYAISMEHWNLIYKNHEN